MLTFLKQHILLLDVLSVWLEFLKSCCNTICKQPLETQEQSNFEQDVLFLQFAKKKKTKSRFLVMLLFHLFWSHHSVDTVTFVQTAISDLTVPTYSKVW